MANRPDFSTEVAAYQKRLQSRCHLEFKYDQSSERWWATIVTCGNAFPHWQRATADTLAEAWAKLKAFLDGGPQLHGVLGCEAADFLAKTVAEKGARHVITPLEQRKSLVRVGTGKVETFALDPFLSGGRKSLSSYAEYNEEREAKAKVFRDAIEKLRAMSEQHETGLLSLYQDPPPDQKETA